MCSALKCPAKIPERNDKKLRSMILVSISDPFEEHHPCSFLINCYPPRILPNFTLVYIISYNDNRIGIFKYPYIYIFSLSLVRAVSNFEGAKYMILD
jgi:hypothetical protein